MRRIFTIFLFGMAGTLAALASSTTVSDLTGLQAALSGTADTIIVSQTINITSSTTLNGNNKVIQVTVPFADESGRTPAFSTATKDFYSCPTGRSNYGLFKVTDGATLTLNNMTLLGGFDKDLKYDKKNPIQGAGCVNVANSFLVAENVNFTRSYRGIYLNQSKAVLKNCNVVRNVCMFGGGVLVSNSHLLMDGCSLTENRSLMPNSGGGAMEIKEGSFFYGVNIVIANNSSQEIGGAINIFKSTAYLLGSTITGNSSSAKNDYGAKSGGALGNNRGWAYIANSVVMDNYYFNRDQEYAPTRSDIGVFTTEENGIVKMYYSVYGALHGSTFTEQSNNKQALDDDPVYASYRQDGTLMKCSDVTPDFKHSVLTSKSGSAYSLYAPLSTTCATGGTECYIEYNNDLSTIKMGYKNSEGDIVGLGNLSAPDASHKVTTYYEGTTRGNGTIGASAPDARTYYTVKLSQQSPCVVKGATVYGDSYVSGTFLTVEAVPDAGYGLYWETPQGEVESTDNPYTFTLTADTILLPKLCLVLSDQEDQTNVLDSLKTLGNSNAIMIKRTFKQNATDHTICLPFSLTAEQLAACPLAGFDKLQEFSSATIENAGQINETLVLTMKDATSITAGKPYIIAWPNGGDDIKNPIFNNMVVTREVGDTTSSGKVKFVGTFVPKAVEKDDKGIIFVGKQGALNWPNVGGNINGFRSYFELDLSVSSPLRRGMNAKLAGVKTIPTDINSIDELTDLQVYKLIEAGRVVIISNGVRYNLNGQVIK